MLPGAADVRIFGERQVSMRIDLDRTRLAGYRLTVQDVEDAIRRQNAEIPAGRIESSAREFTVVAETDLRTPEQFAGIIVANVGGYPVRIRDVGNGRHRRGRRAHDLPLQRQAGAQHRRRSSRPPPIRSTSRRRCARKSTLINESLPSGMKLIVAYDTSMFIDRVDLIGVQTIGEAIILVVLVIFFFLRSLRATIIPIVTIPVSLVGAFALMYAFGFTVNTLTLLAMVLAIGLVVDDAIVVLENIFRHMEEGMTPDAGGACRGPARSPSR